ncbi:ABC transporter substrate-binding protein [Streptomyces sp. B-S-A8]|uniref:ABC transporter substrate-binding protein n=1 Tax=Streptomyces solicavernae TaxID=3043614 RepID=A0ABT6RMH8_9ACTN|nr:ABC transporter substrate-binding protein [Streptomyces sp. B-S-A8]MDI3385641.1 ABC transporter substrate-binding protein [Streptomyces sp. B-S-A8]
MHSSTHDTQSNPSNPSKHSKRIRNAILAGSAVVGMLAVSACSAASTTNAGGSDDKVTLAQPSWAGAQANIAVAKKLLEDELGVEVDVRQMNETAAFTAMDGGQADAVLEDWHGNPKQLKTFVEKKKSVVSAGELGVKGHIGWYVPKYYADKHPDITNWKNLNKYADDFKTSESKGKGQFIGADPEYSQHDTGIIKNLDLDFTHVPSGSESAQQEEIERLYKAKKPFLTYWWTPQVLQNELELVEVELPKYTKGCNVPVEKADCGYPHVDLEKFMNADFAKNGGDAAEFIKNFKWSNEDQDAVVNYMTQDKMKPEAAAEKWIKENKDVWEAWLPKK